MTSEQETYVIIILVVLLIFALIAIGIWWWMSDRTVPGGKVTGTRPASYAIFWVIGFLVLLIVIGAIVWASWPRQNTQRT